MSHTMCGMASNSRVTHLVVHCRSCDRAMVYLKTAKGKRIPVDALTVGEDDHTFDAKRHTTHFVTCPDADKFRKQKP